MKTTRDPFRDNPVLAAARPGAVGSRRKLLAVSVALHALVVLAVLTLPQRFSLRHEEPEPVDVVFYRPPEREAPAPPPPVVEPEPPRPEPTPKPRPEPNPAPKPKPKPIEIAQATPPAPRPEPPRPEPKPRPKPVVRTDVFAVEQAPAPAPERPRQRTRTGSFAEAETVAAERPRPERPVAAAPAGFDTEAPADQPVGSETTKVVAAGAFGGGAAQVPQPGTPKLRGAVTTAGFGTGAAPAPEPAPAPDGAVRSGGFGDGAAPAPAPAAPRRAPKTKLDAPVEILSKPAPVYTAEARELRIEGEVVLEVTFDAAGSLRVLRVVGGLGHGLDEAAVEAAEKIEFKPARRDGKPVDHTTTLRVVFQLA